MKNAVYGGLVSLLMLTGCEKKSSNTGQPVQAPLQAKQAPASAKNYASSLGYTASVDPRDFGLSLIETSSRQVGERTLYNESFGSIGNGFMVVRTLPVDTDMNESYVKLMAINCKIQETGLNPGQGIRLIGEGNPEPITLDDMPGLKGGIQLWTFNSEQEMLNDIYQQKGEIRLQLPLMEIIFTHSIDIHRQE